MIPMGISSLFYLKGIPKTTGQLQLTCRYPLASKAPALNATTSLHGRNWLDVLELESMQKVHPGGCRQSSRKEGREMMSTKDTCTVELVHKTSGPIDLG
jgi:hypothetical protein